MTDDEWDAAWIIYQKKYQYDSFFYSNMILTGYSKLYVLLKKKLNKKAAF